MAQGITPEFLEELKYKCDIVQIISQYVTLQKKGGRYFGCCPFHNEKTPSFAVMQSAGYYHCFGCGVSGDVIKFVQEMESLDFMDAVRFLADKVGMELPEVKIDPAYEQKKERRQVLREVMRDAARFYRTVLLDEKKGAEARQYLAGRGLDAEVCRHYGIGLSPDYESMPAYLRRKGYKLNDLLDCGLISNVDRPSDAFANRIIVPIISSLGDVVAFGGRIYHGEQDVAKYKNSTNTQLFDKGRTIYGVNFLKRDRELKCLAQKELILVEGYMDVISLGAAGIKNAVAGMGTALTEGQARELGRLTNKLYVCYDGDGAGRHAALKNLQTLRGAVAELRVVSLPDGKDPDETVRSEGKDAFYGYLQAALPVTEYMLQRCEEGLELKSVDGRAAYVTRALEVLKDMGNSAQTEVYASFVAAKSGISAKSILDRLKNAPRPVEEVRLGDSVQNPLKIAPDDEPKPSRATRAARFALNRLLNSAPYCDRSVVEAEWFASPVHRRIAEFVKGEPEGRCNVGALMDRLLSEDEHNELDRILDINITFDSDMTEEELYDSCLLTVANEHIAKRISEKLEAYNACADEAERRKLLVEYTELQKKQKSKNIRDKF